jgi:hypothetical protein
MVRKDHHGTGIKMVPHIEMICVCESQLHRFVQLGSCYRRQGGRVVARTASHRRLEYHTAARSDTTVSQEKSCTLVCSVECGGLKAAAELGARSSDWAGRSVGWIPAAHGESP